MSASNLKLNQNSAYSCIHIPMRRVAEWWADGTLRPTVWQRAPRWNPSKDNAQWISCVLGNTPIVPIFAHQCQEDTGRLTYHLVDGQNRSAACHAFLITQEVSVRAGDVLRDAPLPDAQMKLYGL